jgi:hypothetical protein
LPVSFKSQAGIVNSRKEGTTLEAVLHPLVTSNPDYLILLDGVGNRTNHAGLAPMKSAAGATTATRREEL